MLGLVKISHAVLTAPACDVLHYVAFAEVQAVGMDVLDGLNGSVFVVVASHLLG